MSTRLQPQPPAGAQPAVLSERAADAPPKANWQRLCPHPSSPRADVSSARQTIGQARSTRRPRRRKPTAAASRSSALRVRSSMNSCMLIQDAPNFFDSFRVSLGRMSRSHDEFRFDALDVRAFVLHHSVVSFLGRTIALYRDDRMSMNAGGYRQPRERLNKRIGTVHVVEGGREPKRASQLTRLAKLVQLHRRLDQTAGKIQELVAKLYDKITCHI